MEVNPILFTSQSHYIGELLSDVEWKLTDDKLIRCAKKNEEITYYLSDINNIRLCFHMGGRGTPAKYCCYFSYQNQTNNKQIFSAQAITSSPEYRSYYLFVNAVIKSTQKHNVSLVLFSGHGIGSLSLYLITTIGLLLLPYIIYQNHIITYQESIWSTLVLLLLCSPMIVSIIKYYPKKIVISNIPKNILPKPKEV